VHATRYPVLEMDADISIHLRSGTGPPGPPATPSRDISISGSLRKARSRDKIFRFCPGPPGQNSCPGIGNAFPTIATLGLKGAVRGLGLGGLHQSLVQTFVGTGWIPPSSWYKPLRRTSPWYNLNCTEGGCRICTPPESSRRLTVRASVRGTAASNPICCGDCTAILAGGLDV